MSLSIASSRSHDGVTHASDSRASRSRASQSLRGNVPMLPNMMLDFDIYFEQCRRLLEDRTSPRDCTPFGAVEASRVTAEECRAQSADFNVLQPGS
jgi:hypothetical protein